MDRREFESSSALFFGLEYGVSHGKQRGERDEIWVGGAHRDEVE